MKHVFHCNIITTLYIRKLIVRKIVIVWESYYNRLLKMYRKKPPPALTLLYKICLGVIARIFGPV